MPEILLVRLDAPLMSFGGPAVDNYGGTEFVPSRSMLVGLMANALGYDHRDHQLLSRLQQRVRCAVRCERRGEVIRDYQTVALGEDYMSDEGAWTTKGLIERRAGGSSKQTHIRYRDYLADSLYTVTLCLEPAAEEPVLGTIGKALQTPARPLFIGRKCGCQPPYIRNLPDSVDARCWTKPPRGGDEDVKKT